MERNFEGEDVMSWKNIVKEEDMLDEADMGDGVPLSRVEENLYQALANVEDMWEAKDTQEIEMKKKTIKRLEDALKDMADIKEKMR